ncbi:molybdopterin guanine dinucleotide-containing S/N-oxide reductase [Rhodoferax sp.]|uniref:molybdopterin guanine dinucleotide-containing S/N-oxide reductase n=1 Tax=Rhodoferax sp. TaxID=50421 RepID=UPI00374DA30A
MSFTSTHWGVYQPVVENGRLQALQAAPWDVDPSPIGTSLPEAIHAPVRVQRPAVREGFLRAAQRGQAATSPRRRGQEAFVEIPWDEALDLVAAELQRVRTAHGNEAIFGGSYGWSSAGRFHHAQGQLHRFLNGYGGYAYGVDTYSLGAGRVLLPHIVGNMDTLLQQHTSWDVLAEHCELFMAFGGLPLKNGQVSPGGASDHQLRASLARMAQGGTRFVNISPVRADLDGVPDAEWLPIKPGSDTALMLALAQVWLAEGLYDRDFLDRYTVGFELFEAYVLGRNDGVAKTPQWAAGRTGIDANTIVAMARRMAAGRTMVNAAYALQRARHGEQPFWMTVVLAAMLGQIGLPGGGFGLGYGCMNNTGSGRAPFSGPRLPQGSNPVQAYIPVARLVDMLLHPGEPLQYNGRNLRYPDIRLVYWAGGNPFHHHQDLNRTVEAWQRPETIIVHEPFWTATARHADIVLPVTTPLERDDIGSAASDRFMVAMKAAIAPVCAARDDFAIFACLAGRLGFGTGFTENRNVLQWLDYLYEESRERAAAHGIGLPAFAEFWKEGLFEVPHPTQPVVLLQDFRNDPLAHPLPTPSGRIEIHSATIAGFDYGDCPGHPVWFEPEVSAWPLHLLSNQPATRLHSQYDHGQVSRDSKIQGREPIAMHPDDAVARGIADGAVVRVYNQRGAFLAGVRITTGIARGVVQIATGAWYDPLDPAQPGSLDVHGNPNMTTPDIGSSSLSQGCSAQTTYVEVVAWDGPLPPIRVFDAPSLR